MSWSEITLRWPVRIGTAISNQILAWWRSIYLGAVVLVLLVSPSSYQRKARHLLVQQMYVQTAPNLVGFTVLAALLCAVITHIVMVIAHSFGLSRFALDLVVRVIVIEMIPLTAALFVASRCSIPAGLELVDMRSQGQLSALRSKGLDPIRVAVVPRAAAGMFAALSLAALSAVVALVTVYFSIYGLNSAGFPTYTRIFGRIFSPSYTLVLILKTVLFSMTIAIMPMASALYAPLSRHRRGGAELGGFARMFAVLLLIEVISLMGNYY